MAGLRENDKFLDRFVIRAILGEGGSARVYRAWDANSKREVALKILTPGDRGYAPDTHDRFAREVEVIANLRDPHTVTLFDSGRSPEGLLYLVFEYISGRDLEEVIFEGEPLDEATVRHILSQLLRSLREAHAAGLLHRDIKPVNIRIFEYLDDPYYAKLLDFGIARLASGDTRRITREGALIGTPQFMAPEQIRGQDLTPATDIYSLGLVTYEMLTRRAAVDGKSAIEIFQKHLDPAGLKLPPDANVSPGLRRLVERMIRLEPENRFRDAQEALTALSSLAPPAVPTQIPTLDALPEGLPEFAASRDTTNPLPQKVERPPSRGVSRRIRDVAPLVGAAAGGLFAVLGVLVLFSGSSDESPPRQPSEPVGAQLADDEPEELQPRSTTTEVSAGVAVHHARQRIEIAWALAVGSPGCGLKADRGSSRQTFELDGLTREFMVHTPRDYDPGRAYPVILLAHHSFDRHPKIDEFAIETGVLDVANDAGVLVVSLRSVGSDADFGKGHPWRKLPIETNYVLSVLERVADQHCVDSTRTYAIGHGSGGDFLERARCDLPLAAIVTSSNRGTRPDYACEGRPVPHLHLEGRANGANPIEGTRRNCHGNSQISLAEYEQFWREFNECEGERLDYQRSDGLHCTTWSACKTPFVSCLHDDGFDWPHAAPHLFALSKCLGPNMNFPAAGVAWQFFVKHRLPHPSARE